MAYYLEFDGVDDYVDLASPISASGDGVLAEIDFVYQGASNDVICGGTSFSDYWRINNDYQFRISIAGIASNVNINTPLVVGERYTLRLVRTGSSVVVEYESGVAITPSTNFNANPFIIGKIGSFHNGSSNLAMDLYEFKANNSANNYSPSASNGTGQILPDTVVGNDGTLVNFPTDNSQWIYDPTIGAIEPTDYYLNGNSQPAPVVVPYLYNPTTPTQGQTLVLTESVLEKMPQTQQDAFWGNVENTGGDLRLTSNQDGTGRLPLELVSIDTTTRTLVLWYRLFEDFDGVGNVYLWFGKVGETQPAITDPFGRNAVWSDYLLVWHGQDIAGAIVDSSGNQSNASVTGSVSNAAGAFGYGQSFAFDGSSGRVGLSGNLSGIQDNTETALTYQANVKLSSTPTTNQSIIGSTIQDGSAVAASWMMADNDDTVSGQSDTFVLAPNGRSERFGVGGSSANTSSHMLHGLWANGSAGDEALDGSEKYLDGTFITSNPNSEASGFVNLHANFEIGGSADFATSPINGVIDEVRFRIGLLSQSFIATEYANQSDPTTFYGTPTIVTTGGTDPGITAEVSLLFNSIAQNTMYLEYKKYIQALISTNAELETSLSKGQEIAATLGSVTDNQLASIKESIVKTILIMNSDYNNLAEVSKSAATKLELVDSVSSVATVSKILSTQNINSSIDTDLLVKCQKVLSIVVDSVGSTAVKILSDTIKEAVASIVISSSADSSVSLLAAKATSIVSLIISTDLLIQANKQGLTSISTGSKATTVVVPKKGVNETILSTQNTVTNATALKGSIVDTEVLASDTEVSNYIEVYKYVPSLIIESAASNDIIIDVGKQTATFLDSSLASSLEVNINKTLGTITIESNTELLIVTLNNFTDSNIIKIDSSIVMPASISNTTVKTPSRIIDAVIRIK